MEVVSLVTKGRASLKRIALFPLTLAVAACVTLDPRPTEDIVAGRAQARVDLLMSGDYEGSYAYTTPGYRSTERPNRYASRWAGVSMWTAAEVDRVSCESAEPATRCKVAMRVDFKAVKWGESSTILQEQWIYTDGNWFLYQNF